jgi:hypothetical protein
MSRVKSKKGFALPMAIAVMVVLVGGVAAGYMATSAEVITNAAHRGDTRAYNLAVAGLEQFLANRKTLCARCATDMTAADSPGDSARVVLNGGYATVVSTLVRRQISSTVPAVYLVTSTGVDESIKLSGSTSGTNGMRTVALYATWNVATVNVQGAWFALSGLRKNGNAGRIDGTDNCPASEGGGQGTLAGAVIPSGGQFSGDVSPFQGSPPIDTSKTFTQLKESAKLDWAGIIGGSISADFTIPSDAFPSVSWFTSNPDAWPVIRVKTNNYTLPNAGRGMIIADSNFTISGSNMWDGIVLIGGKLTSNGNNTTAGATFAGLNYLLGGTPEQSTDDSDANGQKTYVYHSCNVSKAASGLQSYRQIANSYMDQIPVW